MSGIVYIDYNSKSDVQVFRRVIYLMINQCKSRRSKGPRRTQYLPAAQHKQAKRT